MLLSKTVPAMPKMASMVSLSVFDFISGNVAFSSVLHVQQSANKNSFCVGEELEVTGFQSSHDVS